MRRRGRRPRLTISLFPFLSILACVIGILTLLISSQAMSQVLENSLAVEEKEHQDVQDDIANNEGRAKGFQKRLDDAHQSEEDLKRERNRRGELGNQLRDKRQRQQEIEEMRDRIGEMQGRVSDMDSDIDEKQKERDRRTRGPDAEGKIGLQPGGSGTNQRPYFVECTKDALIIHHSPSRHTKVPKEQISSHAAFQELLARVKQGKGKQAILIFLIRPGEGGVKTYDAARQHVDSQKVRHGKLPLPSSKKIDFTLFRDSMN